MRPELLAHWNELGGIAERQQALLAAKEALSPELFRELEEYWKSGGTVDQPFAPRAAVALLLQNVKRYEAALLRIAEKPEEQHALMEHRQTTGQEVPASDLQRWFAYLDTAHIARAALGKEK